MLYGCKKLIIVLKFLTMDKLKRLKYIFNYFSVLNFQFNFAYKNL